MVQWKLRPVILTQSPPRDESDLSKRKTTSSKSDSGKIAAAKGAKLIATRGMGMPIKIFRHEGVTMTADQIVKAFKQYPYNPKSKTSIVAGFGKVTSSGEVVAADFVSGFKVQVMTFEGAPVHYISVDSGTAIIKLDRGTIEVRGSDRIARKFRGVFEDVVGGKLSPLDLNGGTVKLYNSATDVASVLLIGVEKGNITQAEFRGAGIQREEDIGMYQRRYKGQIGRFRGTFAYPSGAFLTTTVNAEAGSLMVYRSGEGILEKDLNWIVELMEDAALTHGQGN